MSLKRYFNLARKYKAYRNIIPYRLWMAARMKFGRFPLSGNGKGFSKKEIHTSVTLTSEPNPLFGLSSGKFAGEINSVPYGGFHLFTIPGGSVYTDCNSGVFYYDKQSQGIEPASFLFKTFNHIPGLPVWLSSRKEPRTIFSLLTGGGGNSNYFHWLYDVLPRLSALPKEMWKEVDVFLFPNHEYPFQKETLGILGIPENKVKSSLQENHWKAGKLLCTTHTRNEYQFTDWVISFLRNSFITLNENSPEGEKIYLSRGDAATRRIVNEPELVEKLKEQGFKVYELSKYSFQEQVGIFNKADVVVAPHGAALANLAFCRPGAKILEIFSPGFITSLYYNLCDKAELEHHYLIGETSGESDKDDITVAPGKILAWLEENQVLTD